MLGKARWISVGIVGWRVLDKVDAVGTVQSPYSFKISHKTTGRINFLEIREGDPVKPGQVLVRLDPGELDATVAQQRANLAQARARLAQASLTQSASDISMVASLQQKAGLTSQQLGEMTASDQVAIADSTAKENL